MNAIADAEPTQRMIVLPTRGGAMAALEFGPRDRPVDIVFSHANGFNACTYRTILQPLAADLRILALDLRGHGASTLPAVIEGRQGWLEFRDDLLALLTAVCTAPVVLAGHSMGGTSSLLAAAAQPERVRALALFDPVVMPVEVQASGATAESPLVAGALKRRATFPSKPAAFEAYLGRGGFRTWSEAQLADYVEAGFRDTEDGQVTLTCAPEWEASNFRTHNYDAWAAFRESRCPIRVLRAAEGSTFRVEGREAELGDDGRIQVQTIPKTSHFLPMERPELVRNLLASCAAR
ncbi:MAG TPA: alpha/beta hydrolase [Phenylobacterium sp.]|jgi:pimeloyl-ACP methyl ester carboxylesterase|uniref:alpha/beta fold hydrolase n=1 Tax=Phenylobacterium sp. TaxID=1871053 RepID=UPI002D684D09|nr:alpha/beta hydrolase [Phenylobacterium sp.]HZZ68902.1 alpha/beta hydrolase [Phenylobacterium sp.]